jgi:RNA polymerase sigma-70 factor (ECF subfamily)
MTEAYTKYRGFVKRSVRRLGVTPADADDAVQQVFLVVHRRLDHYLDVQLKRSWLLAVSKLVSCNYHRGLRRARSRRHQFTLATLEPGPDVEELLAQQEARRLLEQFLEELEEKERAAFYLAHFEGLTAREIALRLGMNMNTVYTRLRTARLRFEKGLAGKG